MKLTTLLLTIIITFFVISCGDKGNTESTIKETENKPTLDHIILKEKPAKAIKIADLRTKHQGGETVTFEGQIIGAKKVFINGLAIMTMGDPTKMTTCDKLPGDTCNCKTPWDACCDVEDIKDNIITVQILDKSGAPIKAGIKGLSGIKEMSALTITGVVDKSSNEKNMIINATGIFVN